MCKLTFWFDKKKLLATMIAFTLSLVPAASQIFKADTLSNQNAKISKPLKTRNGIWFTPVSRNTRINGMALGLWAMPMDDAIDTMEINGINISIEPLSLTFFSFYAIAGTVSSLFESRKGSVLFNKDVFVDSLSSDPLKINGLSISGGQIGDITNGISLNLGATFSTTMNGMSVSTVMNGHYSFKGVLIAGLRNKTTTGSGLQIGLINTCRDGNLVQIGLINRIGKRIVPIMNFRFRRNKVKL